MLSVSGETCISGHIFLTPFDSFSTASCDSTFIKNRSAPEIFVYFGQTRHTGRLSISGHLNIKELFLKYINKFGKDHGFRD